MIVLEHPDGRVLVSELGDGRRGIEVQLTITRGHGRTSCETQLPVELIQKVLAVRGPGWLCDELARDEDPTYVQRYLTYAVLSYVDREWFAGKRLLDFGCGSGSSTLILSRMLPATEIVGVELREDLAALAEARAGYYGSGKVSFSVSPGPQQLPPDLGTFDFVTLSAVFEHLLPAERPRIMAQIWSVLRPGGILFVNQTPQRWFPVEFHTTGLPFVNYLPRAAALEAARRFSRRVSGNESWEELLRKGIRGATEAEVLSTLKGMDAAPKRLAPSAMGFSDKVDLWYACSMAGGRPMRSKRVARLAFKAISLVTRWDFTPSLHLAILKAKG